MKNICLVAGLLLSHVITQAQEKNTALFTGGKKKLLGVYNTSTFHVMPGTVSQEFSSIYGTYNKNSPGFSFRNTTGYRFFDALNLGAGTGIDRFESVALNVPFYGEISGNILRRRFTPVYFAQAGYGLGINATKKDSPDRIEKAKGGLMLAAGIGFGGRLDRHTILRINFGYRMQKADYTKNIVYYDGTGYTEIRHMTYHRVEIGLGFTFQ